MPIAEPEHLLDQAARLATPQGAGPPRQVDLRRAISAAYYAVFHTTLVAAADEFVGRTKRSSKLYALVYRSVDHRTLRDLCVEVKKPNLPARYARYVPASGFGRNIPAFAAAFVELQEKRHSADYDPLLRIRMADALLAIKTARTAVKRFAKAGARRRKTFLTMLLFPPR